MTLPPTRFQERKRLRSGAKAAGDLVHFAQHFLGSCQVGVPYMFDVAMTEGSTKLAASRQPLTFYPPGQSENPLH